MENTVRRGLISKISEIPLNERKRIHLAEMKFHGLKFLV
jgi:hypothetical protein